MVKDDLITISSVVFTRRAVAGITLRHGGYPQSIGSNSWLS